MPELPEVETIRRDLSAGLIGRKIVGVTVNWPKMVQIPSPEAFKQRLTGQTISALDRRGKYLIFQLDSGEVLIIHLRMSGSLLLVRDAEADRYARAVFVLDDDSRLVFRDTRKLGVMWLVEDAEAVVGKLGPEPLDDAFTTRDFAGRLRRHKAPIKAVLLDQSAIAGIGNMYADESLFAAGIHPRRRACDLSNDEIQRLFSGLRRVLKQAIECCGASVSDYRRPGGARGTAQSAFRVAHQKGKPCPQCGTPIERIVIRQRGTCFCPRCQPEDKR